MGNRIARIALASLSIASATSCAYPHAKPLQQSPAREFDWEKPGEAPNPLGRYYFSALPLGKNNTDRLFVVLTFSGGGSRAAAMAYGVLDQLRRITLPCSKAEAAS